MEKSGRRVVCIPRNVKRAFSGSVPEQEPKCPTINHWIGGANPGRASAVNISTRFIRLAG
jgi:hypothetical protein